MAAQPNKDQGMTPVFSLSAPPLAAPSKQDILGQLEFFFGKPAQPEKARQLQDAQDCLDQLADVADNWKCITANLSEKEMTLLARDILDKNLKNKAVIKEIDTKGLGLHLATAPSKINFDNPAEQDNTFEGDCSSDKDQPIKNPSKKPAQTAMKGLSNRKLKLLDLAIYNPAQVKIFRENYHSKSGGSLLRSITEF